MSAIDPWQQTTGRRQERPVGWPKMRAANLPPQDRQFMADNHNLELLELCRSEQQEHQLQNALNRDVADGHEHGASEHTRKGRYFTRTELRHPTGSNLDA